MLRPRPLAPALGRATLAVLQPARPLLAQLVVTRRCNLSCGYCNEYDQVSNPVPTAELERRIDKLADLGTVVLTLTGGEPLLHPELDVLVRHAVSRGMVTTSITNGYPINRTWISKLNAARLTLLQLSIDNLDSNEMSEKSWNRLQRHLGLLRDHARFKVTVNAVLGSCSAEETRQVVEGVAEMGFYMTVGLMHDGQGQITQGLLDGDLEEFYDEMQSRRRRSLFHRAGEGWERDLIRDGSSPWKCRAGGRYLYVDEFGMVNYCSQRRGEPGIALADYTRDDLRREFYTIKGCEDRCTVACVRRASAFDGMRGQSPVSVAPAP